MRVLKSNSLLSIVNSYVGDSPQPVNLSYAWNFGSLLATCLGTQIVTGVLLAMHYTPSVDLAFVSVEHIMRDVNYGWLIRYIHANVASFFFIFVYLHVARGLYYGSYKAPRTLVWSIGVIILVLMMAIAFLGYYISQTWWDTTSLFQEGFYLYSLSILPLTRSERCDKYLNNLNVQPKAVFENLDTEGVKATVSAFLKPLAGVYLIINLVNGNMYVGSAITGRMPMRFYKHLYGLNGSKVVAAAVQKYGLANFAFVVLDTVSGIVTSEDNRALLAMENDYIQLLLPEYNVAPQAGNTFGVTHTEATKLKMRINYSSERREAIGSLNRGKKLSPATIERIRLSAQARPPMSPDTRQKVSANSAVANLYVVSRVDNATLPNGSHKITLRTIPTVAEYCNCDEKTVRRALAGSGVIKKVWQVTLIGKANI